MKKTRRNEIIHYTLSIVIVTTFLIVSTYFAFLPNHREMVGALSFLNKMNALTFEEVSGELDLAYNFPVSDELKDVIEPYQFRIINHEDNPIKYQLCFFTGNSAKAIPQHAISYQIQKNNESYSEVQSLTEDGTIYLDTIEGQKENIYSLKFWLKGDLDIDVDGSTFQGTIQLNIIH